MQSEPEDEVWDRCRDLRQREPLLATVETPIFLTYLGNNRGSPEVRLWGVRGEQKGERGRLKDENGAARLRT